MKSTGIIRKFDDLGRIVIPRAVREQVFGTNKVDGVQMEIFLDENNNIILKTYKDIEENN